MFENIGISEKEVTAPIAERIALVNETAELPQGTGWQASDGVATNADFLPATDHEAIPVGVNNPFEFATVEDSIGAGEPVAEETEAMGPYGLPKHVADAVNTYPTLTNNQLDHHMLSARFALESARKTGDKKAERIALVRINFIKQERSLRRKEQWDAVKRGAQENWLQFNGGRKKLLEKIGGYFGKNEGDFWAVGREKNTIQVDWQPFKAEPVPVSAPETVAEATTEMPPVVEASSEGVTSPTLDEVAQGAPELSSHERMRAQKAAAEARLAEHTGHTAEVAAETVIADQVNHLTEQLLVINPELRHVSDAKLVYKIVSENFETAPLELGVRLRIIEGILNKLADVREAPPRPQVLHAVTMILENYNQTQTEGELAHVDADTPTVARALQADTFSDYERNFILTEVNRTLERRNQIHGIATEIARQIEDENLRYTGQNIEELVAYVAARDRNDLMLTGTELLLVQQLLERKIKKSPEEQPKKKGLLARLFSR